MSKSSHNLQKLPYDEWPSRDDQKNEFDSQSNETWSQLELVANQPHPSHFESPPQSKKEEATPQRPVSVKSTKRVKHSEHAPTVLLPTRYDFNTVLNETSLKTSDKLIKAEVEVSSEAPDESEDPFVWARFVNNRFHSFPIDKLIGDPTEVSLEFVLTQDDYFTYDIDGAKYKLSGASLHSVDDPSLRITVNGDELRWSNGYRSIVVGDPENQVDGPFDEK